MGKRSDSSSDAHSTLTPRVGVWCGLACGPDWAHRSERESELLGERSDEEVRCFGGRAEVERCAGLVAGQRRGSLAHGEALVGGRS